MRFHATTVSRWLVMPIAAIDSRPTRSTTSPSVARTASQISTASCSTQPGRGKCWVNSRYAATAGRPSAKTARLRMPVVPASIATTQVGTGTPGHPNLQPVRVGMLTGGGDCPGLNAVIRAIVRHGERIYGDELIGFLDAWDGCAGAPHDAAHGRVDARDAAPRGHRPRDEAGEPVRHRHGVQEVRSTLTDLGIDAPRS